MRSMFVLVAALMLPATVARAQDPFPVSIGVGGGVIGGARLTQPYHGLLLVELAAPRYPVALRLDGLWTPPGGRMNTDLLTSVSASAVITLRPWRVAPYLLVGVTRTADYVYGPSLLLPGTYYYQPAVTQLSGGLGLNMRVGRGRIFGEVRTLQEGGNPITFGMRF